MFARGTSVPLWRRLLAGAGGLASAAVLFSWVTGSDRIKVAPPMVMAVVAAIVVHVPRLGPQVFARAAWWANVGLGVLIALFAGGTDEKEAVMYLVPSAFALLVIGRRGITEAEERSGHVPSAFRSSLLLLMVLALADAQTFTVFGLIVMDGDPIARAAVLFAAAAALTVGFVGLFRLALWGALLNLVTCAVVFVAVSGGLIQGKSTIRAALLVLSGLHVLLAAPVMIATLRRKQLPALPPAVRSIGMTVAILGLVALAISKVVLARW